MPSQFRHKTKTEKQNKTKEQKHTSKTNQNTQHKTNREGEKWPADQLCDLGSE